jgi:hypothetical protein
MHHVPMVQKDLCPDHFHQSLCVSPTTFDQILTKTSGDPVFFNKLNTLQQPVKEQLAIMLFQLGHFGNAASLQKVANSSVVSHFTVCSLLKLAQALKA